MAKRAADPGGSFAKSMVDHEGRGPLAKKAVDRLEPLANRWPNRVVSQLGRWSKGRMAGGQLLFSLTGVLLWFDVRERGVSD